MRTAEGELACRKRICVFGLSADDALYLVRVHFLPAAQLR